MNRLTNSQREAVNARGNVIVVAGAGTGKTSTLVARCLALIREGESLEKILMVTFTDAAAAEMRYRIREALRHEVKACHGQALAGSSKIPSNESLRVPPHPGPLPKGEGELSPAGGQVESARLADTQAVPSPLPEGEGQGEGEGNAGTPNGSRHSKEMLPTESLEDHYGEQLSLLEAAHISTLHGFCLHLVREHFYDLQIDPDVVVLDEPQTQPLIRQALDTIFERQYAGQTESSDAVQSLVRVQGRGADERIRELVLKLHRYTQSLPDPRRWLNEQLSLYRNADAQAWRAWFAEGFWTWRRWWRPGLEPFVGTPAVELCLQALDRVRETLRVAEKDEQTARWPVDEASMPHRSDAGMPSQPADGKPAPPSQAGSDMVAEAAAAIRAIQAADERTENWPRGTKTTVRSRLKRFFAEAEFLDSLAPDANGDPLQEDWHMVRHPMVALLELTQEFSTAFSQSKRALGGVDFSDLEQLALRLLRDPDTGHPTNLAHEWRQRLEYVFVDEYQDINGAQDAILTALSREPDGANRFLVGDVKQSIYRFRLANPAIFRRYEVAWGSRLGSGRRIFLADNFRSRETILDFVNSLFGALMREDVGGVRYEPLEFGAATEREPLSRGSPPSPRVEFHWIAKGGEEELEGDDGDDDAKQAENLGDLPAIEREARLVALRLLELHRQGHEIWDKAEQKFRPVQWRDMVVLLRSPSGRAEAFAMEFHRLGVPLEAARGGFFQSTEISDLLCLLRLIDNPFQDIPLLAVLRSPLVGMSVNELGEVRAHNRETSCWLAVKRFHREASGARGGRPEEASAWAKVDVFLSQFERWRAWFRQTSLSDCLESVLAETHYESLLWAEPRGEQRAANVRRLLGLARQFDPYQRQGLFRFLRFVEAQEELETDFEPASSESQSAVRLLSIHKSKGLEFPVVVLAGLGGRFNFRDLCEDILLDERYGLCPKVAPPDGAQRYPSLPHWLANQRQRRELLGEELRLFYVAATRARDTLILTAASPAEDRTWSSAAYSAQEPTPEPLPGRGAAHPAVDESSPPERGAGVGCLTESAEQSKAASGRSVSGSPPSSSDVAESRRRSSAHSDLSPVISSHEILSARSCLDWMRLWLPLVTRESDWTNEQEGRCALLRWTLYSQSDPRLAAPLDQSHSQTRAEASVEAFDPSARQKLCHRLAWQYPFPAETMVRAKTTVSELRRRRTDEEDEAQTAPFVRDHEFLIPAKPDGILTAADVGTAHHTFLEHFDLSTQPAGNSFRLEAERLVRRGLLSNSQRAALDLDGLAAFWESELGRQIRDMDRSWVRRELPFTARFSPASLRRLDLPAARGLGDDEFVVVQGVVDLAVIQPGEIWLVDFKTDAVTAADVEGKVKQYQPQLELYAEALARIHGRPVSKAWLHFLKLRETVAVRI
ncbi:MAG: UvrD-helicase domain-containing protein [Verrucomicrobia bacterium]|nr:UvrD-helicase domain-containing protein [Verrucomicrobiota bacterium]